MVPGRRPGRGRQAARRPLPLRHRLPQRAPRPHLGLHRCAARLPGVLRRPDQDRRRADALAGADRSLLRDRRRDRLGNGVSRQQRRPQRHRLGRRCSRTSATTSATSASWRVGVSLLGHRADDRRYDDVNGAGIPVTNSFSGRTPHLGRRRHLQVGARRQRAPAQLQAAGRVLPAARERHADATTRSAAAGAPSSGDYRAAQNGWYLQAIYQFMPMWRVGAALRPARFRHAAHRPGRARRADRCRLPDPAARATVAHVADVRLLAVRVQPLAPAARAPTAATRR